MPVLDRCGTDPARTERSRAYTSLEGSLGPGPVAAPTPNGQVRADLREPWLTTGDRL
jgi:hypothetical protein